MEITLLPLQRLILSPNNVPENMVLFMLLLLKSESQIYPDQLPDTLTVKLVRGIGNRFGTCFPVQLAVLNTLLIHGFICHITFTFQKNHLSIIIFTGMCSGLFISNILCWLDNLVIVPLYFFKVVCDQFLFSSPLQFLMYLGAKAVCLLFLLVAGHSHRLLFRCNFVSALLTIINEVPGASQERDWEGLAFTAFCA